MKNPRSQQRVQKRTMQRQIEKALKNRNIVPVNEAFNRIKSELTDFGWLYEEEHNNSVEYDYGKWRITSSPALKLFNQVFHITLIPHNEGIEISRIEVYKNFQRRGYAGNFLKCILQFLLQHEIDGIFLIPLTAGLPENLSSNALDVSQLQQFYFKRGFRKIPNNNYWKLDKSFFLNSTHDESIDFELLKINSIPIGSEVFIGKLFDREFQSMPIKMRLYRA